MQLYSIYYDGWDDCGVSTTQVFASLADAKRAAIDLLVADQSLEEVEIDFIETPRLTAELLINVINSNGGKYVAHKWPSRFIGGKSMARIKTDNDLSIKRRGQRSD
jgi:hypothetical protein